MVIGVDSLFAAAGRTIKGSTDNVKETDSSIAREAFLFIFKLFHRK
jgi:hypothetical protein